MMIVATKNLSGSISHEWPSNGRPRALGNTYCSTPYSSKIQPHTIVADNGSRPRQQQPDRDERAQARAEPPHEQRDRDRDDVVSRSHTAANNTERPSTCRTRRRVSTAR